MYKGPRYYGCALNCHLVYLALPGTRLICMKKTTTKFACLIYMQLQKVKFKSVQINMKQVSFAINPDLEVQHIVLKA